MERERSYIGERADALRQDEFKRNKRFKRIGTGILVAAISAASILGYEGVHRLQGRAAIIQEFADNTSDFGYYDSSYDGYHIMKNGKVYDDFDDGIVDWIEEARASGMTDQEIYVGMSGWTEFNNDSIKEAIGDDFNTSTKECWDLCGEWYHKAEAKEANNGKGI